MEGDPREAARDRRARRFAAGAALLNTATALTGLVLGTCVLLLMWPYVLAGAGLLVSFVLLITVGAAGQLLTAEAIWRRLQSERSELGRPVLASAVFSGVIGIPALAWTFYLAGFIARGSNFWGYEWVAVAATAVLCIPAFSGCAALIAFWRYHRVYAAMAPVVPPVPPGRRRVVTGVVASVSVLLPLMAWWSPGGPPYETEPVVRGRPMGWWITELQLKNDEAARVLAGVGRPAVEALADRLAAGGGLRWAVADWMGNLLSLGGNVAEPLEGVRVRRLEPQRLREVANALPAEEHYWLPEVLAARLPAMTDPNARDAAVWGMSLARAQAVPWLLNVIDTEPGLRLTAVQALLWALPRRGEEAEPPGDATLAELDRRAVDESLPPAARWDLAGTIVRLAPPGPLRERWLASLRAELQAAVEAGDAARIAATLRGMGRCGEAGAPLADAIAAMPDLGAAYKLSLPMAGSGVATATYTVYPVWTLRGIAPRHPAVAPAIKAVLAGSDHAAHRTALYLLAQDLERANAQQLRAQILQVMADGSVGCLQQGLEAIAAVDGDIAAALPVLKAQWGAGAAPRFSLIFHLQSLGVRAAPALPFLRSQLGVVPAQDADLRRLIEGIEAEQRLQQARQGPEGK